ncbi:MAG: bi-domain-containing oxidoreductase [Phycisphaerales bacterium]|nr:bi-domain-containing oxidoreductase [Phycisphaerales bacterium]MCB9854179.1 bi-domain-containing oxidoreductase [Phycisphaerales bacterium]
MRQVLQNLRSGETTLADVPCPMVRAGHLLIQSRASLISAGTERMLVEFGKGGLLAKARAQPEKVRQVLDKIKTDGLMPTLETVFARLDEPLPLGYCNAGVVLEVGVGVEGYSVGDHVISNGAHAEIVCCPANLCAKVPDGVSSEEAAFTVLSAIALQGIRLIEPTLGERVVVTGLGLIGLVATQLLLANGCRVLGIDLDERKLELAREWGAETVNVGAGGDPVATAMAFSEGRGADAVLITASAKTSDIVHQAAQMCRKRGRIVLVGVVGLDLKRSDFYEKELSFQVSCSYGPGRYDASYEEKGQDYPYGFVRWTEQRNFEAILELMSAGRLRIAPMIERSIPFDDAPGVYDKLSESKNALGLVLKYPDAPDLRRTLAIGSPDAKPSKSAGRAVIGAIGAGNYAKLMLLPAFAKTNAVLRTIASAGGVSARHVGAKFGFQQTTTDYREILSDESIDTVVITTRHSSHARFVCEALDAGKHVFVEKPLALNPDELDRVMTAAGGNSDRQLLVGFNRRFSPHATKMASLLAARSEPLTMIMTVNAGFIPPDHWTQDPQVGGGRIIGEGCHWIDLLAYLANSPVVRVSASNVDQWKGVGRSDDKTTITLTFADGSMGTLHYLANGHKSFPKERLEVFSDGRILALDNFRVLRGYGFGGFKKMKTSRMDKGHDSEVSEFVRRVANGGTPLIPLGSIINTTRASFAAVEAARSGTTIEIPS